MTEKFEVGEIAIIVDSMTFPEYSGQECEITGPLDRYVGMDGNGALAFGIGYTVRTQDGRMWHAPQRCLKKKRPPQRDIDQVTSWDLCAWKPGKVTA